MTIVVDNNVIIDAVAAREPFAKDAGKVIIAAGENKFRSFITANSATDIFYVMKKTGGQSRATEILSQLFDVFQIASVSEKDCRSALALSIDDFEDALIAVCAKRIGADFIVSRDEDFLKSNSPVPVLTPKDFLEKSGLK